MAVAERVFLKTSPEVELMETCPKLPPTFPMWLSQNFSGSWINGNICPENFAGIGSEPQNFSGSWINGNPKDSAFDGKVAVRLKTSPEVELMETTRFPALLREMVSAQNFSGSWINGNDLQGGLFHRKVRLKTSPEVELMETRDWLIC